MKAVTLKPEFQWLLTDDLTAKLRQQIPQSDDTTTNSLDKTQSPTISPELVEKARQSLLSLVKLGKGPWSHSEIRRHFENTGIANGTVASNLVYKLRDVDALTETASSGEFMIKLGE